MRRFHQIEYTDDAIQSAVYQSSRYISDRYLPDKAIDVLDEAGARVKLANTVLPSEVSAVQKKLKVIVRQIDDAITAKEFDRAAKLKDKELHAREDLQVVKERWKVKPSVLPQVTKEHSEEVISRWTGIPVSSLKEEENAEIAPYRRGSA